MKTTSFDETECIINVVTALVLKGENNLASEIASRQKVVTALVLKGENNGIILLTVLHLVVTALVLKGENN